MQELAAIIVVPTVFLGLPWIIFHYVTKWKSQATLSRADETMLEELHAIARRLDERVRTVERIVTADNPNWRALACDPAADGEDDMTRRIK